MQCVQVVAWHAAPADTWLPLGSPIQSAAPHPTQPPQVRCVERDTKVQLYQGTPEDICLAVVAAGSSHSASISRRWARCGGLTVASGLYTWRARLHILLPSCSAPPLTPPCCLPPLPSCPQGRAVHLGPGQQRRAGARRVDAHRGQHPPHDHQPAAHPHRQRGMRRQPHAGHLRDRAAVVLRPRTARPGAFAGRAGQGGAAGEGQGVQSAGVHCCTLCLPLAHAASAGLYQLAPSCPPLSS